MNTHVETPATEVALESGAVIAVPLNKLKKSPRNARRVPHTEVEIEGFAASIAVKGVLQPLVVEPETDGEGAATGCFLTTIGEGRRLALLLLAKRKVIRKTHPVRCVADLTNDPHEISLDENVNRVRMHPADEFEAYRPDEIARGGVFVILGQDGVARIERGFILPEDLPAVEPDPEPETFAEDRAGADSGDEAEPDEPEEDAGAPLSERLVLDLTAQRTLALRDALATSLDVALSAVVHALAAAAFYPTSGRVSCLEIKPASAHLAGFAPGIADSRAGRSVDERHERWAVRLPREPGDLWAFVQGLTATELLELLAHCASLTVNAVVMTWDRRPHALAQADRLAEAVDLDMTAYWSPTVASYLGRVTKAKIAEAVSEGVSVEAAARIGGLKKPEMASEAEALLAGKGWLPSLLWRREPAPSEKVSDVAPVAQEAA